VSKVFGIIPLAKQGQNQFRNGMLSVSLPCPESPTLSPAVVALNDTIPNLVRYRLNPRCVHAPAVRAKRTLRPADTFQNRTRFIFRQSANVNCGHISELVEFWRLVFRVTSLSLYGYCNDKNLTCKRKKLLPYCPFRCYSMFVARPKKRDQDRRDRLFQVRLLDEERERIYAAAAAESLDASAWCRTVLLKQARQTLRSHAMEQETS
jgi:hypothetical protein